MSIFRCKEQCRIAGAEESLATVQDRLENRLGIGHRATDDLQYLRRRGLPFECFLGLVEEP
ncbi:MAG: hypothetical protein ABIX46_14155, partial [Burkholderiaceae bacterium]